VRFTAIGSLLNGPRAVVPAAVDPREG